MAADLPLAQMQRLLDDLNQMDPKVTLADADFWHFAQTYSITADVTSINTWQQTLNPTAVEVYMAATGATQ